MRLLLRFFGFLFTAGSILFLAGLAAVAGLFWHFSKDLPDYTQLQNYEPPVMTRVHAADGSLLAEYAKERRLYLPIQAVPKLVINSFLAAEDKNFYEHGGVDYTGMARAGLAYIQNYGSNRRPQGASTITQQVAKNFLLTNEVSFSRKIKEALLAMKIERAYSKDKILELYLNEIYLGLGAYGIAAASLVYFDKSVNELTIAEAAYLAALPKMPASLHPVRNHARAVERRNYVIDRLQENGWITAADADKARKEPLVVTNRASGAHTFAGEYFSEEVRRDIFERYGEKKLYEGGLSVRTTLDPKIQVMARKTMVAGLVKYDEQQGYRGPIQRLDISGDWGVPLAEIKSLSDISPWRMAVVLETSPQSARIGFQPGRELGGAVSKQRETGIVTLDGVRWAKAASGLLRGKTPASVAQVLQPGDVIYADPLYKDGHLVEGQYRLRQIPEISGAMVAMDPRTGRVLAMVGGFSFDQSQFNRATQAYRQPGSTFKPIVYSAALDNGYTGSTMMIDAPIEIDLGQGNVWRPENFSTGRYQGQVTLRNALRLSLNTVTVRLAQEIGMPLIGEYAKRFGVYDELPNYLSYALGAGETTVMRMVTAYSMIANGGRRVKPTLIDRIQDRYGHTIFKHDQRECIGCDAPEGWKNQPEPQLIDRREQVLDAMTAYQITSLMEGVVQAGTGTALKEVGKPIAGKTGTSNEAKDLWFVGFSPDLVVGLYVGYDKPRSLGRTAQAGHTAAPIARDFMKLALADKPPVPFKIPPGIRLVRVVAKTGARAGPGETSGTLLEAFKPGQAPPIYDTVPGTDVIDGTQAGISPDADRAIVRSGTGGLY
ncbi:penicillin-binding protein 1A [Bradyrhizobium sp. ISRA443]|uniref:penicillin-binding protein 1A n=1 Tax=unclassified Bradyrhizobium TaxID=2631580 RepID=UPI002478E81D|nr:MULTISPECIES: penicillin-binding protein 1A [unclassified Bradyrhizobium]WGR92517.1 penicillin-binding protein 1A [Bradyrhizobium sp. ISRA435]WGR96917.1 penicillin-binding protein 1A [Bradyrhizobium sp. ISRA436]WGS03804.1 penicillin-binding protein 1A [Bradyrhizobium sp. ISRA437]WGS10688.1 penicillin-binding protein 1A [Bradyrhizobium sp. ISRA443]